MKSTMNKPVVFALVLGAYSALMSTYVAFRDPDVSKSARIEVYRNIPDAEAKSLIAAAPGACEHRPDLKLVTCTYR